MSDDLHTLIETFQREADQAWNDYPDLAQADFDETDVETIGRNAAEIAIGNLFWRLAIGSSIRASELAEKLGRDEKEITCAVAEGLLVGLTGRYQTFLPLWQFEGGGDYGELRLGEAARMALAAFHAELGSLFRPDYVISWASTKQPELGNQEPRSLMSHEEAASSLEYSAKVTAGRLAQ
ncbi:hypothetical protein [Kitasatospora herbaricolor]|uniref:HDOD domain-containing protein n=1 Tax=Kitasatospora herbaricolor TaxID=68217 RepID=A0ABZ1VZN6_9ACTN|nr:hypothetical protein [Kitasatospora herbaricolor]